jgi:L-seryl-tRNA(Ser) seleniumtransferase
MTDRRRAIPSVSALLETRDVQSLLEMHPRNVVVNAIRRALEHMRESDSESAAIHQAIMREVDRGTRRSLRPVFNATGVILHTNLGRAPLADAAVRAIQDVAGGYTNLEYDIESGERGSRYVHCADLLRELTGAQDAIVVNNCASAMVLALSAMARDREVIVSRGELVEIGGSFRVPDIMQRSGAKLVEVGTTNRTHLDDYARAITSRTGAIAKVHRSNFALSGFVSEVGVKQLAPVAAEHDLPILHDLGSGLMIDLSEFGLSGEPTARDALGAGATIVMMSADKLLGGPQAGIILGAGYAISRLKKDPFARAMRVDKLTIAALTATLELYRDRETALREIPTLAMIAESPRRVRERSLSAASSLNDAGIRASVIESRAAVGAGAFPTREIESFSVVLDGDAASLEEKLRQAERAVIGRIADNRLTLDLRSVPSRDDSGLVSAVIEALG